MNNTASIIQPISMDMDQFRSKLFDSIAVGLAVLDRTRFHVLIYNTQFQEWCPEVADRESVPI